MLPGEECTQPMMMETTSKTPYSDATQVRAHTNLRSLSISNVW